MEEETIEDERSVVSRNGADTHRPAEERRHILHNETVGCRETVRGTADHIHTVNVWRNIPDITCAAYHP